MEALLERISAADGSDPVLWLAVLCVGLLLAVVALARRPRYRDVEEIARGQERLFGALTQITEAQVAAQSRLIGTFDQRLSDVAGRMDRRLAGDATRTAETIGAVAQRLDSIDRAQEKIERLSTDVLGLQDILSNKQARGAFGEVQLRDIVTLALPPASADFQVTLSNGRRVDCLVRLPDPPGSIAIDAKFPLEAYHALVEAQTEREKADATRALRTALRAHIDAIAERYLLPQETADQALLFLPSEAVYAELHANHAETVRYGFERQVWVVSPSTAMAVLTTLRGVLKDVRLREEASRIRRELGLLTKDLARMGERVGQLDRHFAQAQQDLEGLRLSAEKAGRRGARLETLDFGEDEREEAPVSDPGYQERLAGL
ncbi:MAG: DNA recombination protein RmuC [Pseudomonadota bacterium]